MYPLGQKGHRGIFVTEKVPQSIFLFPDNVANCSKTAIYLQPHLNSISKFCNNTDMRIRQSKTETMVFRIEGHYECRAYNNNPVKVTAVYKYMGLLYIQTLSCKSEKKKKKLVSQPKRIIFVSNHINKSLSACHVRNTLNYFTPWLRIFFFCS